MKVIRQVLYSDLKARAFRKLNRTERGKLKYVKINVKVPNSLTKKQKDILKSFEESHFQTAITQSVHLSLKTKGTKEKFNS